MCVRVWTVFWQLVYLCLLSIQYHRTIDCYTGFGDTVVFIQYKWFCACCHYKKCVGITTDSFHFGHLLFVTVIMITINNQFYRLLSSTYSSRRSVPSVIVHLRCAPCWLDMLSTRADVDICTRLFGIQYIWYISKHYFIDKVWWPLWHQ